MCYNYDNNVWRLQLPISARHFFARGYSENMHAMDLLLGEKHLRDLVYVGKDTSEHMPVAKALMDKVSQSLKAEIHVFL